MALTLQELIEEKEKNLNRIPDKLLTDIQKSEKEIYGKIISLLDKLKRDSSGNIEISKANIAIAADITNELKIILNTKSYLKSLREFANGFDTQAEFNDDYFRKVFKGFKTSVTADALLQKAKKAALDQLLGAPAEASFITPVAGIVDTAVSSGVPWTDLSNQIKDFVLGADGDNGKLAQHASQVAYDSFAFSDRAYTNIISETLDSKWRLWSGSQLETSRCFCEERKGKYFHVEEIRAWGRGEDIGACKSGTHWQGADANTNEQTIFIVAGGYRCIDSILPVSVSVVPLEDIQRNIDNGNYEPTEKEIEMLGL